MCSPSAHPHLKACKNPQPIKKSEKIKIKIISKILAFHEFIAFYLQRRRTCTLTPFSLSCLLELPFSLDRRSLTDLSLDFGVADGEIDTCPPLLCSIPTPPHSSDHKHNHNKPQNHPQNPIKLKLKIPTKFNTKTPDSLKTPKSAKHTKKINKNQQPNLKSQQWREEPREKPNVPVQ